MKKKVKVYFDFLCPFCYRGVMDLLDLMPEFPDLMVDWEPCEAHPRPETCNQYSDLASEAFLYIKGHHGDLIPFLKAVYQAHFEEGKRIDDRNLLVELAAETGIEAGRLRSSLVRRDYKQDVMINNNDIWEMYGAEAVPAYYCRNKKLVSRENHLISKEVLRNYLQNL